MACLVSDIVSDVILELSQVPGVSTQVYATPRIEQLLQDAAIMMMDEMWWPDMCHFYTAQADGVTGVLTTDLVSPLLNHKITRFQDIEAVYPATTNKRLKVFPPRYNPLTVSGSFSNFIIPDATQPLRPFAVLPITASDVLSIRARSYPQIPMSSTDTIYLDRLMMTYFTAYMYEEDDGTNPGAISKFKALFEKRLEQVKSAWAATSVALDPRFPDNVYEWSERE